ncbi:UDP-galactose translocator [Seminavis robusta]|uniref:UDP-galactose translocator n=1 Tax=Seminavis robusta TaxID=568900 RepID=A0A9N8HX25_9STRA|nr:UDP-galactose translocator [Seminavis robusta]|eukprot:Sro2108_g314880.1 UDP-galactose translocator (512) ;mRNA; f:612-2308
MTDTTSSSADMHAESGNSSIEDTQGADPILTSFSKDEESDLEAAPLLHNDDNKKMAALNINCESDDDALKDPLKSTANKGNLGIFTKLMASKSNLKSVLLVLLVIQGSSAVLVGRYTRSSVPEEDLYDIGHLVLVIECFKFVLSLIAEFLSTNGNLRESIEEHIWKRPVDSLKVLVPAVLYVLQNGLIYIALSNLPAPVFISLQQGKLICTAIVSVTMLRRTYSVKQWCCLFVLAVGVAIVAVNEKKGVVQQSITEEHIDETTEVDITQSEPMQFFLVGILAVSGASFTSAFAGVYFEKVLAPEKAAPKSSTPRRAVSITPQRNGTTSSPRRAFSNSSQKNGTTSPVRNSTLQPETAAKANPGLWIRNLQLAFFSILFCLLREIWSEVSKRVNEKYHAQDDDTIYWYSAPNAVDEEKRPYLHGFTFWVWVLVLLQAGGGLLVAAVMKYADNVLKGLAMGIGVVVASVVSTVLFKVHLSSQFVLGAFIICGSVYLFSNDPPCLRSNTKSEPK